jgi:hypothetical protein
MKNERDYCYASSVGPTFRRKRENGIKERVVHTLTQIQHLFSFLPHYYYHPLRCGLLLPSRFSLLLP